VRAIGVCYGVIGSGLPSKSDVVQLYKSNGIASMRFYFADQDLLTALRGSGIALALDVGNDKVGELASDPAAAASWVRDNVQTYYPDVDIRCRQESGLSLRSDGGWWRKWQWDGGDGDLHRFSQRHLGTVLLKED